MSDWFNWDEGDGLELPTDWWKRQRVGDVPPETTPAEDDAAEDAAIEAAATPLADDFPRVRYGFRHGRRED